LQSALGREVPVRYLFDASAVGDLADHLHRHRGDSDTTDVQEVVPVQTLKKGTGVPLFCIHPGGGVSWPYQALGNYLDCPIIGIQQIVQDEETEPRSIREMAKNYADRIQAAYPPGPYNLLGWSLGGIIAHELAIELQRRGCVIVRLILLDADPSIDIQSNPELGDWKKQIEVLRFYFKGIPEQDEPLTYEQIEELLRERGGAEFPRYKQVLDLFVHNVKNGMALYQAHKPGVFDGDIIMFSAVRDESNRSSSLLQSWRPYIAGDITVYPIDCTHQEMLTTESLSIYGEQLKHSLVGIGSVVPAAEDPNLSVRTLFDAPSVRSLSQQFGKHASSVEVVPTACPASNLQDHADDIEAERKAGSNGLRYADYLHLEELLGAVRPLFADGDRSAWGDERYFLIIHQISELWVSQILLDLELALESARLADFDRAIECLKRANAVLELTLTTQGALQHLAVADFHQFRPRLQGVSAAQSDQFATLLTGIRHAPVAALFEIVADGCDGGSSDRRQQLQLAAQLDVFIAGLTRWRLTHLDVVRRFIGDSRGTGGTAGIGYLIDQLDEASRPA
jgi:thioesterase domain-containing protein/tryptophan 2,3-dioxygenase